MRTTLPVLLFTTFSECITQFPSFVPMIKLFFSAMAFPLPFLPHLASCKILTQMLPVLWSLFYPTRSYHSLLHEYCCYPSHSFNTHLNAYSDHIASQFDSVSVIPAGMQTFASKDHFLTTLALPELSTEVCTE